MSPACSPRDLAASGSGWRRGSRPSGNVDSESGSGESRVPVRSCAIIYNPTAGRRGRRRLDRALGRLKERGVASAVTSTTGPGHATEIARAIDPARVDAVVVAGGDGTMNEVVNGMAGSGLPVGLLPIGSANVLAREIGLGWDMRRAADCIADGLSRPVHLGRCNGRYFLMMAGVGFDAHVVARVDPRVKRTLGRMAYVLAGVTLLGRFQPLLYRFSIDGSPLEAASLIVSKGRHYAGPFVLAGQARLESPDFHVCVFERPGRANVLRYVTAMALNRLRKLPDFKVCTARTIRIDGPEGEPVQTDGDVMTRLPATIEIGPTINLFVPA
jgi:diacylglycerol kinase (ATP)